jgi:hypothetical protein
MKAKALQFGKAISAALFVLLLVVVGSKNALAQTQVATLQHGEDISVFYGQNAFVDAHNAAQTGDVITLSSGTFTPTNITKAITLRGAGCVIDTVTGIYPTIIPNSFQMNVTNNDAFLTIEGIYFSGTVNRQTLNHPKFIKCNFENFSSNGGNMQNAQISNCKFKYFEFGGTSNTMLINCVIWGANALDNTSRTVNAYNSFIYLNSKASALNAYNCIIKDGGGGYYPSNMNGNSVAYNCIGIQGSYYGAFDCQAFNCIDNKTYSQIFETFNPGDYYVFSFTEPFILKEEIATGFLGNDGTEVGIHGGIMPYSSRPSYMVIEQCNVANRSTIDGKLSVEIEVTTQGE